MLNTLSRILPLRVLTLEARLKGVAGYTGSGLFRYVAWSSGHVTYDVDLRGVAGLRAVVIARGENVAPLAVKDGKAAKTFDSRRGDPAPALAAGDMIEIRQNGDVILQGVLKSERD
ncbi:MAG: hypothetical protein ACOZAA_08190 [Pseudomonadota bacterium]